MKTFADDLRAMMTAWDTVQARARATYPNATEEQVYQVTAAAMNYQLKLPRSAK